MGSKSRIAKYIVPIIQSYIDAKDNGKYFEPFCGGCNVIDKIKAEKRIASDANMYLIELFKYIQYGGELPETITREEYSAVRSNIDNYPKWYAGCVGFLASYNGRWFDGGYAGTVHTKANTIRDYYDEARRNILSQVNNIQGIDFYCKDYREAKPKGYVIYADPPYKDVKQYANSKNFNNDEFWETIRNWSKDNIVLISECQAPNDFKCIWQQEITRTVDNTKRVQSIEKLFKLSE